MTGISSLGIGSGLDLNALVSGLVNAERAPTLGRLNRSQAVTETELSALGRLRSAVEALSTAIKALDGMEVKRTASSSSGAVVGVATSGMPEIGNYQVRVQELASAQSLASAAFDDTDAPLGLGTLTLQQGDQSVDIELTEGANSLHDVRDAINASSLGIQAVVVRDGGASRLLLTSANSGTAGEMTLSAGAGVDARLDSAAMTETAVAKDAVFSVNGLQLSSASNRVDDVIPGLELNLRAVTEGADSVTITVAQDRAGVRTKVDAVVTAYNSLVDTISSLGRADPEGNNSGPLVGDSSLRAIQSHVGGIFSAGVDTGDEGGALARMLDLGLSVDVNGKASLDVDKLNAMLTADEGGVQALLSGFAADTGTRLESFAGSGGIISSRTDGLNDRLRRLQQQREALDLRMAQVEQRLRNQFTALDAMLVQFQSTSAYLSQQLASLDNLRPGR